MKKMIFGIMAVVALSMVAVLTTRNSQHNELFEIQLANIEALADPETNEPDADCSKKGGECVVKLPEHVLIFDNVQKP